MHINICKQSFQKFKCRMTPTSGRFAFCVGGFKFPHNTLLNLDHGKLSEWQTDNHACISRSFSRTHLKY